MLNTLNKQLFQPKTEVIERELEFSTGTEKFNFRLLTSSEVNTLRNALSSSNFDDRSNATAWVIKTSLCNADGSQFDDDGTPIITEAQVKTLKDEALIIILAAVFDINFPRKKKN